MSTPRIFAVLGAGGGCGKLAVAQLAAASLTVRAIVRDPAKYAGAFPDGVDVRAGDVTSSSSLRAALSGGVTHVLFAASNKGFYGAREVDEAGLGNTAAVCKELNVAHLVAISSGLVHPSQRWHPIRLLLNNVASWGIMDAKWAGECLLRASGQPYTIVRPGGLGDGPPQRGTRRILVAQNRSKSIPLTARTISRDDVAAVCVAAFAYDDALNATVEIGVSTADGGAPSDLSTLFSAVVADT